MSDAAAIAARGRVRAIERADAQVLLDANADAPIDPRVLDRYFEATSVFADARASHAAGDEARRLLGEACDVIADILGCEPSQLTFTSGGTEADALALEFLARPLIVSAIEHAAVAKRARELDARIVPVDRSGRIIMSALEPDANVSIVAASNETGVIQPTGEIAERVHARGFVLHTDAIQLPGRAPFRVPELGADFVSYSAHKIGAPAGTGLLVTPRHTHRPETHVASADNIAGIAAMARAFELVPSAAEVRQRAVTRDTFEEECARRIPQLDVIGGSQPRLNNTSCLMIPGCQGDALMMALDIQGFAVSTGSACASGSIEASPILLGMGLSAAEARCAVRFSFGDAFDPSSIAERVAAIVEQVRRTA